MWGKSFVSCGHVVVLVDDAEASFAFYRDVLGLDVVASDRPHPPQRPDEPPAPTPGLGVWLMAPSSPHEAALVGRQAGHRPLLVMLTEDLIRLRRHLVARGVDVWAERRDADGHSLHFSDPQGNVIVASQPR
ncbi:VOC family protein [Sinomonas sp. ASV322]|uniref:VOC family protein n=1 Tax=Sinomonas sp. ASV322 TaxID=3041920 RepID=UPI0027DC46F2|nr:VOC family protein [Sinomonas sp. ASV322]MDQ4501383.1 VOC family protein [Sinomonas sp. ASV322]